MFKALSWPAPPYENHFIKAAAQLFEAQGFDVEPGNPISPDALPEAPDVYIIHWPEFIFRQAPAYDFTHYVSTEMARQRAERALQHLADLKRRGTRVIWVVHNLKPHDLPARFSDVWDFFSTGIAEIADGWVTLSPSTREPVSAEFPALSDAQSTYIWHPPYPNSFLGSPQDARRRMDAGPETTVFGHIGALRPYKNVAGFVARFDDIAPAASTLLIAGRPTTSVSEALSAFAETLPSLTYRAGTLDQADFDSALTAIDVFVAPYSAYLHSGSIVHALCRGCVVIAPAAPFSRDLQENVGGDWMHLYEDSLGSPVMHAAAEAAHRLGTKVSDLRFLQPANADAQLRQFIADIGIDI